MFDGDEIGVLQHRLDVVLVEVGAHRTAQHAPQMQDADDVVHLFRKDRQAGVIAGGDLMLDGVDRVGQVDALDRTARRHDVLDRDVLELEQVDQDAAMLLRDVLSGFDHQRPQLLGREAVTVVVVRWVQAEQFEQTEHEDIDETDDEAGRLQQKGQRIRDDAGETVGMVGADDLGRDFREHQNQEGDQHRRDAERPFLLAEQFDRDHADQHCGSGIDQIVEQQDDAEQAVGFGEQVERQCSTLRAVGGEGAQSVAIGGHHGRLSHRKCTGEHQQDGQRHDPGDER